MGLTFLLPSEEKSWRVFTLDCDGERLGIAHEAGSDEHPITHLSSELNPKTVKKMTILLTCNGATAGYQKVSLANIIADKTQSVVCAAKNAKVNYIKGTGIPYLAGDSLKTIVKALLRGCWFCTFPKRK